MFITGKCVAENIEYFQELAKRDNIELGGHTYSAFRPILLHHIYRIFFGSYYGPKFYRKYDIQQTINAFKGIGIDLKAWRTHGYMKDAVLYSLLSSAGIEIVSDEIRLGSAQIYREHGLWQVPITMPPDDEIYRAVIKRNENEIWKWKNNFQSMLRSEFSKGKDIIIQAHPLIQGLMDGFEALHQTLKMLKEADYKFLTLSEYVGRRAL